MVVNVVDATQQKIDYKQKSVFKNVFVRVCVFFWCPCVPRLTYLLLNVIDQARKRVQALEGENGSCEPSG